MATLPSYSTHDELLANRHSGRGNPVGANTPKPMASLDHLQRCASAEWPEDLAVLAHRPSFRRTLFALFDVPKRISSWAGYPAAHQGVKIHAFNSLQSDAASVASTPITSSLELLGTTKQKSTFEEPCLAPSRRHCSCETAQVATMPGAWTVMGRRWKTAKFVQAHNDLAARRGAPLATINLPPRTQSSTRALQEYLGTQMGSPPPRAFRMRAQLPVTMRCDSPRFPRRGAASKLLLFPSARKELESMHAELHAVEGE
ncbi:hypothetical protein T484DRAFT_1746848 [Baffinella frigidus]|nr:hypothetical protein T484DRAFT_1746848 [Cryptophyta sp. CCMP2293]